MKTLQQQYQLIKEGKGNKEQFLKQARNLFPDFITVNNDYKTTVHILKSKSILSEGIGGVTTINPNSKPDWFKIFDTNLREAVGVKNTKEYGDQNEFEKIDSEVQKTLDKANFDYKDEKNIDNVYGQSFLMGYYTEMKDPKNADKTVDELKDIVLKNMSKDVTYYNTKASFGVKDIGYTKDVVGGGEPVAPKGKYKSSGYGDMSKAKVVKEGMEDSSKTYAVYELSFGQPYNFYNEEKDKFIWGEPKEATLYTKEEAELKRRELLKPRIDYYQRTGNNYNEIHVGDLYKKNILREGKDEDKIARYEKYTYTLDGEKVTPDDIAFYDNILGAELDGKVYRMGTPDENGNVELRLAKGRTGMYTESLSEAKKRSGVAAEIKEIEKSNEALALEAKIEKIKEAITTRESKLQLAESEELAEMIDPKMVKELQKEIKELEKYKAKAESLYEKLTKTKSKEVIDEAEPNTEY